MVNDIQILAVFSHKYWTICHGKVYLLFWIGKGTIKLTESSELYLYYFH